VFIQLSHFAVALESFCHSGLVSEDNTCVFLSSLKSIADACFDYAFCSDQFFKLLLCIFLLNVEVFMLIKLWVNLEKIPYRCSLYVCNTDVDNYHSNNS